MFLWAAKMLKRVKDKVSLELFKRELETSVSGDQFELVVKQYDFYPRYKQAVRFYKDWHRESTQLESNTEMRFQGGTESTLISLSMQVFLTNSLFFEDADEQLNDKVASVIRSDPETKLVFLLDLVKEKRSVVKGSYFSRGSMIRCCDEGRVFYLISVKTPLDAVYYPIDNQVVFSRRGVVKEVEIRYLLKRFINFYAKQNEAFVEMCTNTAAIKNVAQVARVDRPYHVFADELSGNFYLKKSAHLRSLAIDIPLYFSAEASFFENEKVLSDEELQLYGLRTLFFCYHRRLDFLSSAGGEFLDRLRQKSISIYGLKSLPLRSYFAGKDVVWITVTGGEKPRLKNELQVINEVIKFMEMRLPKPFFIFDGFTATEFDGAKGSGFIDYHRGVVNDLIARNGIEDHSLSLVGRRVYAKIFYSQYVKYVFSSGTPLIWSSNSVLEGGGVIVHGGKKMLEIVHTFTREKNLCLLDSAKDWEDDTDGLRFDRVSYSLSVERTLSKINAFIEGNK